MSNEDVKPKSFLCVRAFPRVELNRARSLSTRLHYPAGIRGMFSVDSGNLTFNRPALALRRHRNSGDRARNQSSAIFSSRDQKITTAIGRQIQARCAREVDIATSGRVGRVSPLRKVAVRLGPSSPHPLPLTHARESGQLRKSDREESSRSAQDVGRSKSEKVNVRKRAS